MKSSLVTRFSSIQMLPALLPAVLLLAILLPAMLCAQAPIAAPQVNPPGAPGPAAAKPEPLSPDTVVIEVDGKKYTKAEVDQLIAGVPVQYQPQIKSNAKFLTTLFVFREMERRALEEKLDQQSPYKEQLAFARTQYLAQMEMNNFRLTKIKFTDEEEHQYYQAHIADKFRDAKVRVIYVAFRPANAPTDEAKKQLTEAEAKAKAEDLRKQLLAGADFATLAKANSDDKTSAEKGGDYGLITPLSSSAAIKKVAFSLKAGEVSEPVREPKGFYLVRVDEFLIRPFDQVQAVVDEEIRNEKFQVFNQELQKQYEIKVDAPGYFQARPLPPGLQVPQPGASRPVSPVVK